jgi:hypothetical protein
VISGRIGKDLEGSGRGLVLRYYPGIRLARLRKTTINLSQDIRSPGRKFNPGPPKYEVGVLTTRPRRSVYIIQFSEYLLKYTRNIPRFSRKVIVRMLHNLCHISKLHFSVKSSKIISQYQISSMYIYLSRVALMSTERQKRQQRLDTCWENTWFVEVMIKLHMSPDGNHWSRCQYGICLHYTPQFGIAIKIP